MDFAGRLSQTSIEAILFDLDGTLVDTMPLHYEAYRRVLGDHGLSLAFEDFLAASGGAARETIPRLVAGRSCSASADEIHAQKVSLAARLFQETPPRPLPTALLLPVLGRAYPIGLVSSGSRRSVEITLSALNWTDIFRVTVTGSDVTRGKPDPQGYLQAAEALSVSPDRCLVFEDMDDGVQAAAKAGMAVFDVRLALPAWRR
ncbi:HAD family phosphatase [Rhizobium sp. SSA_523]|uniref:HAD family hydrolase n=1 Tax=Rhizobium sp. SSA_523 TaxID=2952477 RepID=UPI002090D2AE|nr:HAD family phosphatase [Rhizobium sp. SSA_523]MCO5731896.1 HAD family phosphatase [Rhizobium sp. SSA_523]WKC22748.1 HAD family phosphatase [Rhizobium sp. SSA_523]